MRIKEIDTFKEIDFKKIRKIQDTYEGKIPLKFIPELTYDIWMYSINTSKLSKETKNVKPDEEDNIFNIYEDLRESSGIGLEFSYKRGNWHIMHDVKNKIYWKLEDDIDDNDGIVWEHCINWILGD